MCRPHATRLPHRVHPHLCQHAEIWARDAAPLDSVPDAEQWRKALAKSRLTQEGPLVLDEAGRLYLRRYWQLERDIAQQLAVRAGVPPIVADDAAWLDASLERLFPEEPGSPQRRAAQNALQHSVSLLGGGPGTGKTTTVAAIVLFIFSVGQIAVRSFSPFLYFRF